MIRLQHNELQQASLDGLTRLARYLNIEIPQTENEKSLKNQLITLIQRTEKKIQKGKK